MSYERDKRQLRIRYAIENLQLQLLWYFCNSLKPKENVAGLKEYHYSPVNAVNFFQLLKSLVNKEHYCGHEKSIILPFQWLSQLDSLSDGLWWPWYFSYPTFHRVPLLIWILSKLDALVDCWSWCAAVYFATMLLNTYCLFKILLHDFVILLTLFF